MTDLEEKKQQNSKSTVMCLSIGTPEYKFSIVPNGILVILGVQKVEQITAA